MKPIPPRELGKPLGPATEIDINDRSYPERLRQIYDPPKKLYMKGDQGILEGPAVAIVGSRRASRYGLEVSGRLGFELGLAGVAVVSGLARGIDAAAHRGALKAKGKTVAVMGSGHGHIYPPEHEALYREIVESGLAVTEFADDVPPLPYHFPKRNRIISGLSLGVVVVEAARNSGALITAHLALEQGREVFAVPGPVGSLTSQGTHGLIKDGAALVQSAADILEELGGVERRQIPEEGKKGERKQIERMSKAALANYLTQEERLVYAALESGPLHIDEITEKAGLAHGKASSVFIALEMKGLIERQAGNLYRRS